MSTACALPCSGEVFAQGHRVQKTLARPPSLLASWSQLLRALTSPPCPSSELISRGLRNPRSGVLRLALHTQGRPSTGTKLTWPGLRQRATNSYISFPFHRRKNQGRELVRNSPPVFLSQDSDDSILHKQLP